MATHDYIISNASGAAVRSDLNNALAAIVSNNSSATAPTTTYAYMWWADTTAGQLKIRNAADDGWVTLLELDGTSLMEDGTVGAPGLAFAADTDTGFYRPADNELGIATGGTNAVYIDDAQQVGIGVTTPDQLLHISSGGNTRAKIATTSTSSFSQLYIGDDEDKFLIGYGSAHANQPDDLALRNNTGEIFFATGTSASSEAVRVDTAGRLLVGTTSSTSGALLTIQGNSSSSTGATSVFLQRGSANPTGTLGSINFADSNEARGAQIYATTDGTWATNDYPGALVFATTADGASSPTERMRIKANGSNQQFASVSNEAFLFSASGGASTNAALTFARSSGGLGGGTVVFRVAFNGNVSNTNNSYTAISDIKLKENIVDASSQWDDIKALRPVNYNFKAETGNETYKQLGLIAQEVELVSPGLVIEAPDTDAEGNDLGTTTKSVNYSVLYMKAVKALQEAMERIETLEAKIAALESA